MMRTASVAVHLAPDPVLSRRDDLLDEGSVRQVLAELLPTVPGTQRCERVRARYRRGESLRATYRVGEGPGAKLVSARMFAADRARAKFLQARAAADTRGAPAGSVLFDEALHTVFWVFPEDRKLRGLERLTAPPRAARGLFEVPWVRSDLVAYTPEKAATVRCLASSGDTLGFAKVQHDDEARRSAAVLQAVRRGVPPGGPLSVPVLVALLPEHHMTVCSPAPGTPLHGLPREAVPDAMARLGAALAVLHGRPPHGLPTVTRLHPDRLAAAGDVVRAARPDLSPLVDELVAALLARPPAPAAPVLLHGDLHPKNVLVHDDGVSLVDLDQAGAGPAAAELGATLARLWRPRPGEQLTQATAARAADALLDAYDHPPGRASLVWHAAAALLVERAARAVSRVDVATLADLDQVLTTARHWARNPMEERP
jgi:Ser/Thr protein kinase RdoA (MazF antagonist)